ncbi:putative dihydrofolate synthetase [Choanephora cucurbitarum]|uniref:Dihydrofolate synthetase n=1 Tax=Choanephora cucurbitarum TaxID=101091 RepID=A0A1C7NC86_9FUNG|nr:putative dihydrofolate synthetase [Choanephora cucurbitarum]
MNFGLERIHRLLDALDRPDEKVKIIHVAGTNGKGSVCAYLASVLSASGYRVGRFNSPHLIEPRDSVVIDQQPVSALDYQQAMDYVDQLNKDVGASSFECLVGASLYLFARHQLDFVVLEVGLGGLLDATNAIRHPVMTIITSIGLDHAAILGNTLEAIAIAKAGIMKTGSPVVIAPNLKDVQQTLIDYATERGIQYKLAASAKWIEPNQLAQLESHRYPIPLLGDYQLENSATAVTALDWMQKLGHIQFTELQLEQGMTKTRWPGRLDWIRSDKYPSLQHKYGLEYLLVDGAHNLPAATALRQFIDQHMKGKQILWIMGVTEGKDVTHMIDMLVQPHDRLVAVPFSQPEGMPWIQCMDPMEIVKTAAPTTAPSAVSSLQEGLQTINQWIQQGPSDDAYAVVLCGSLYLVADLYRLIGGV